MEINMPGKISGTAAAEANKSTREIPIFFLMGDAEKELVDRAKRMTPYNVIRKPFEGEQVTKAIGNAVSSLKRYSNTPPD